MSRRKTAGRYRRDQVRKRDGRNCWICGRKTSLYRRPPHPTAETVDHVLPRAYGGTNALQNLRIACHECNHERGAPWPAPATERTYPVFVLVGSASAKRLWEWSASLPKASTSDT